jgi:hypothetical protein
MKGVGIKEECISLWQFTIFGEPKILMVMRKSTFKAFALIAVFSLVMASCNNSKKKDKDAPADTTQKHDTILPMPPDSLNMHDTTGGDTTGKGEQRPPPQ